jgi:hypothetical protein
MQAVIWQRKLLEQFAADRFFLAGVLRWQQIAKRHPERLRQLHKRVRQYALLSHFNIGDGSPGDRWIERRPELVLSELLLDAESAEATPQIRVERLDF